MLENYLEYPNPRSLLCIMGADGQEKTINIKSLDPAKNEWLTNDDIYIWRQIVKRALCEQRGWRSDLSGKRLIACHMHEGIVTRATVPKSVKWHYLIFHPINLFLLLPEEHIPQPPSREWAIEKACQRYGQSTVFYWFHNLPWKSGNPPFRLFNFMG